MASFLLVQWMPGPCTETGVSKEFSIIGVEDVKEDYRYALDTGRVTMATYRFQRGNNVGTMHRLCKILGSAGDKTPLEKDMLKMMISTSDQMTTDQQQGEDGRVIYTIDEDDKCQVMSVKTQQQPSPQQHRPPPWEVEKEMLTLLEENHKLKRENGSLREKLAKAVDVQDLKNILETTIVNIQRKQISQPTVSSPPAINGGALPPLENTRPNTHQMLQNTDQPPHSQTQIYQRVVDIPSVSQGLQKQSAPRKSPQMPVNLQVVNNMSQHKAREAPVNQQPQARRITPVSIAPRPAVESDNPYIVRVQSLAEPTPQTVTSSIRKSTALTPATMATPMDGGFPRATVTAQVRQTGIGGRKQARPRQRAIKPPQWQAGYVADNIVERLRMLRAGEGTSMSVASSDIAPVPTVSTTDTIAPARPFFDDYDGDKLVELAPGTGVKLPRRQLKLSQRSKGASQYTRKLVMMLFNMKELSTSSVTGYRATGRGSENAPERPPLDPKRVNAIIAAVQKRFPQVSQFKVKQVMSQKLMDLRKTLRNKQLRTATWRQRALHHSTLS